MKTKTTLLLIAIVMTLFGTIQAQTTSDKEKVLDTISVFPTLCWDGNINIVSNIPIAEMKVYSYTDGYIIRHYIYKDNTQYTAKLLIPESGTFFVQITTKNGSTTKKLIIIQ